MNLSFFFETLRLAVTNLRLHKLRSLLTSLGIIIGVGAVIAMLAIGEGAKRKTLKQVEQLGATNVILRSVVPPESNRSTMRTSRQMIYGLKREDLEQVEQQAKDGILPRTVQIVALRDTGQDVWNGEIRATAAAVGTGPEFISVANLNMESGRFLTPDDMKEQRTVCVLGAAAAQQLFATRSPLGETIMLGSKVFEVVGVLKWVGLAAGKGSALTGHDLNNDVYFPLTTNAACFSDTIVKRSAGSREQRVIELTEIYVRVNTVEEVDATAAALGRLMELRHGEQRDVLVSVPRELLNKANQDNRTFNLVMGGIAVLSLLVGGIGIMNISLATVTERTREIGVRRALGGKRRHIIVQFLIETTTLSVSGGIFGVIGGVGLALLVGKVWEDSFPTHVSVWSVLVSFAISASVGIVFGVYPAYVAAHKDPIEALRHD